MEKILVEENETRLDSYLSNKLDISRSKVKKLIDENKIRVNDKLVKSSYKIKENDLITIEEIKEEEMNIKKENIPLEIVYEDDDVIVVNKPNKMVVHPAPGNYSGTLVNALLYHFNSLSDINGSIRPGIVHRIDAETTGLLMVAKNNKAHEILAKELEEKKTYRKYIALVHGVIMHDTGTIDAPIGRDENDRKKMKVTDINSKEAITHFKVLERYNKATLIELRLETGRTHQIRDDTGQCLHAKELGFVHPTTGKYMQFTSELPECFINILNKFKNDEF